jgi:hypothetical protein
LRLKSSAEEREGGIRSSTKLDLLEGNSILTLSGSKSTEEPPDVVMELTQRSARWQRRIEARKRGRVNWSRSHGLHEADGSNMTISK